MRLAFLTVLFLTLLTCCIYSASICPHASHTWNVIYIKHAVKTSLTNRVSLYFNSIPTYPHLKKKLASSEPVKYAVTLWCAPFKTPRRNFFLKNASLLQVSLEYTLPFVQLQVWLKNSLTATNDFLNIYFLIYDPAFIYICIYNIIYSFKYIHLFGHLPTHLELSGTSTRESIHPQDVSGRKIVVLVASRHTN